jgi:hypothetical protein
MKLRRGGGGGGGEEDEEEEEEELKLNTKSSGYNYKT